MINEKNKLENKIFSKYFYSKPNLYFLFPDYQFYNRIKDISEEDNKISSLEEIKEIEKIINIFNNKPVRGSFYKVKLNNK